MSLVRSLQRLAVAVGVGAIAIAGTQSAYAASSIDTYSSWDGSSSLAPFGHPDTSTYGQVITIPAGDKSVKQVTWYMSPGGLAGDLVVRTGVYSWDGSKAVKKVATSKPQTIEVAPGGTYEGYKFKLKKAKVKAGQQYVVFATISLDYEKADPGVTTVWPVHTSDVLPGGATVWINDAGNEGLWTTQAWSGIASYDMAFKAKLG